MRGQLLVAAVTLAGGLVGCVNTHHVGYDRSVRANVGHPVSPLARSQAHLFVLNGLQPGSEHHLSLLRDAVTCAGYPMVHVAQRTDAEAFYREMRRLRLDQPDSRFVVVGYGLSAGETLALVARANGDGLPVDAVLLLDPLGDLDPFAGCGRAVVSALCSRRWPGGRQSAAVGVTELADATHLNLPGHPQTVATVVSLLEQSAGRVTLTPPEAVPHLPLTDSPFPSPRPVMPTAAADEKR